MITKPQLDSDTDERSALSPSGWRLITPAQWLVAALAITIGALLIVTMARSGPKPESLLDYHYPQSQFVGATRDRQMQTFTTTDNVTNVQAWYERKVGVSHSTGPTFNYYNSGIFNFSGGRFRVSGAVSSGSPTGSLASIFLNRRADRGLIVCVSHPRGSTNTEISVALLPISPRSNKPGPTIPDLKPFTPPGGLQSSGGAATWMRIHAWNVPGRSLASVAAWYQTNLPGLSNMTRLAGAPALFPIRSAESAQDHVSYLYLNGRQSAVIDVRANGTNACDVLAGVLDL